MQLDRRPRNIEGYSLAKSGLLPGMTDASLQEFLLEGSLDPANQRARRDPKSSLPNSFAEGAIGFQYQLRPSEMSASNDVSLMQKARQSFYARVNLLQPMGMPPTEIASQSRRQPTMA